MIVLKNSLTKEMLTIKKGKKQVKNTITFNPSNKVSM